MTHQPDNPDPKELDALYRAGRNVEPEPGLDRIIQARAEQAAREDKPHRPVRWLGGLATAAALVLAIGVALQQSPPEHADLHEALRAPAPDASPRQEAAEDLAPTLERQTFSEQPSQSESRAGVTASRQLSPAASLAVEDAADELEPAPWLVHIQDLIEQGRLIEAREHLDQFQIRYPDTETPDSINQALAKPESD